jgi:hypothetical protein
MATDEAPELALAAIARLPGRSPLIGWMHKHHRELTELLNTVRPKWEDIARTLGESGIKDARGEAPSVHAVRRAYHRVVGALDAKGRRGKRSPQDIADANGNGKARPAADSVRRPPPTPAGDPSAESEEARPGRRFGSVKPR